MRKVWGIIAALLFLSASSFTLNAQQVVNTDIARVVLGFMIECYGCEVTGSGATAGYEYKSPPIIISVAKGGPGEAAGLKQGDVLTHINGVSITTRDGARLLSSAQDGKALRLTVRRAGAATDLTLTPKREASVTASADGKRYVVDMVYQPFKGNFGFLYGDSIQFRSSYGPNLWTFGGKYDSLKFKGLDSTFWSKGRSLMNFDSVATFRFYQKGRWGVDSLYKDFDWKVQADTILWNAKFDSLAFPKGYRISSFTPEVARDRFTSMFAGLELTIDGTTPVKVTVVEPDCALALDVNGTRILLRSTRCK